MNDSNTAMLYALSILKEVSAMIELQTNLTMYVSRHA